MILDLTKVLDEHLEMYAEGDYHDPEFQINPWCTVQQQGYWVSQLSLGTQTGTHIDAPAHFKEGAATLEQLPVDQLLGPYFFIDLDLINREMLPDKLINSYNNEPVLFLSFQTGQAQIREEVVCEFFQLQANVWAVTGSVEIIGRDPLFFHRALAEHDIYLIEDLDEDVARQVEPGGTIIALPLRLSGVSGSPCRVLVLTGTCYNKDWSK